MKEVLYIISAILWALLLYNVILLTLISRQTRIVRSKESSIIEHFYAKVNKIPAMVEIMRKYTKHPNIFDDIIYYHKIWIISNITSIYDILDLNHRIHREFQFLMKLSNKINSLHKDWNFIYIRNYVIFYENTLEKEIAHINEHFYRRNRLISFKNLSIIWFLFPTEKNMVI